MRNGPELSAAMAEYRVVEMLLYILMNDPDVGPKVRRYVEFISLLFQITHELFSVFFKLFCECQLDTTYVTVCILYS